MHLSLLSSLLAICGSHQLLVSAAALPTTPFPALPFSEFAKTAAKPLPLSEILSVPPQSPTSMMKAESFTAAATCSNPRIRREWDSLSDSDKQAFVDAIKCLMNRPRSGQFSQARNRYEDFVALHQALTPNVHQNAKFLIWHRYYLWTFEDTLRTDCGYNRDFPWWDETRYAGRFSQSSVFSSQWFGSVNVNGNCVTNGQFANLGLTVGPGSGNTPHCLTRAEDVGASQNVNSDTVGGCNARTSYADMAGCAEGGAHAWGHLAVGSVMSDVAASPGDPVFFLHHSFIDRNYRIWQNADPARVGYIDGTDKFGNPLTLDTNVNVYGFRPDVKIRDILDTMGEKLCYRYNY